MQQAISSLKQTISNGLEEISALAERAADTPAYFDHLHTSNGPTETINERLEHLRGIAPHFDKIFIDDTAPRHL